MSKSSIESIREMLAEHRRYFATGETRGVDFRIRQLTSLKETIKNNEKQVLDALFQDLRKSEYEAYTTEIGVLYSDIGMMIKNLPHWARPQRVKTPLSFLGTSSYIYPEPYGTVLIIGPFNYPVNLIFEPLIGAISAGNCAVVKPSELTPNVSRVVAKIVRESFAEKYVRAVEGQKEVAAALVEAPFDYIFFTGSARVGKQVLAAAAQNLVPVTLELGGKSPCIVDETADIDLAAKKIIWGKFSNAGQTCVAPDYLVVHKQIKKPLLESLRYYLERFYGPVPEQSPDYSRIVNSKQAERLAALIGPNAVTTGGVCDIQNCFIPPTILDGIGWEDEIMNDEIFGPILPVLEFENLNEVIEQINSKPKPLALYFFTKNKAAEKKVISSLSYGGGCVNEVLMHGGNSDLPFGGVGASGMGAYHGKHSFETFSHQKSILKRSFNINALMTYPPYTSRQLRMVRKFLK